MKKIFSLFIALLILSFNTSAYAGLQTLRTIPGVPLDKISSVDNYMIVNHTPFSNGFVDYIVKKQMTKNFSKHRPKSYYYITIFMGYERYDKIDSNLLQNAWSIISFSKQGIAGNKKYCATILARTTALNPKYDKKIYIVHKNGLYHRYINWPNGYQISCGVSKTKPQHKTCGSSSMVFFSVIKFKGHRLTHCPAGFINYKGTKRFLKNWVINNSSGLF